MNRFIGIYLVRWLITAAITDYVLSREYLISNGDGPTYLYHRFDNITEEIFPSDIRIRVLMSRMVGTLFYITDRNTNQLIVSIFKESFLEIEINEQLIYVPLYRLCECTHCRFQILDLRMQINNDIQLQCNSGNVRKFIDFNMRPRNTNIIPNEAHMGMLNAPSDRMSPHNNEEIRGCIFSVWYNNTQIQFTNVSSNIQSKCIKSCNGNICNGGQCHDRYDGIHICDCTTTFLNGRYCNDSIHTMNLQSHSQLFLFDQLKLSWKSSVDGIFKMKNRHISVSLIRRNSSLLFEYRNAVNKPIIISETLTDQYTPNREYICVINFRINNIYIMLIYNQSRNYTVIPTKIDLRREIFDSLLLQSGDGSMDIVRKEYNEYRWRKVQVIKYSNMHMGNSIASTLTREVAFVISIIIGLAGVMGLLWLVAYQKNQNKKQQKKQFFEACSIGDEETVKTLLNVGFDINCRSNDGWTALHYACHNGHDNTVRLLLDRGADINCRSNDGWTALHYACHNGHDTTVDILLEKSSNILSKNNHGHSPWDIARKMNNYGCINILQTYLQDAIQNGKNIDGWTQSDYRFIAAINQCNEDSIASFVDDICQIFNNKYKSEMMEHIHEMTPLAEYMKISINCLVASLQCQLPNNDNILNILVPLMEELHPHIINNIPAKRIVAIILYNLCQYKRYQTILDNDRIRGIITKYWSTENIGEEIKLSSAIIICRTFVDIAVKVDLSVYQKYLNDILNRMETLTLHSYFGFTPQELRDIIAKTQFLDACYQGDTKTVESLLNQGVDINSSAIYKLSGLHYACDKGHCSTVQLLLDQGIDINIIDIYKRNALHAACRNGHNDIIRLLLDRGMDINCGSENGQTGLHYACRNGHDASVQLLLDRGANIVPETNKGETPWDMARRNNEKCLKCLENMIRDAIQNGKNIDGWTQSDYRFIAAINQCNEDIIASFVDDICQIFNNKYKSEMMEHIHEMTPLTERMTISINCLVASLHCQLPNNDNILNILVPLMEELHPHITNNIAAMRIVEMILYNLCQYERYQTILDNDRIRGIITKYWSTENISEEIKLSSTVIICHNILDVTMESMSDRAVSYLSGIIQRMEIQRLDEYIGFSRQEIKDTISQVDSHTEEGTDKEYIHKCMNIIGWNTFFDDSHDSTKQDWIEHIKAIPSVDRLPQLRLERMYDALINSRDAEYWRNIAVLLVHTRIFLVSSIIEDNIQSLQCLMTLLNDKYKQEPCINRQYLLECMMDFIEDVCNGSDVYGNMNALVDAILSFVAYYSIIDNYNYERDLTFLESYPGVQLWSQVIMCAKTQEYVYNLMKYVSTELMNEGNITKDVIIVYMTAIQCIIKHSIIIKWNWTNMDYQLIDTICKCDILTKDNIASFNSNIIQIFNNVYQITLIENIGNGNPISESDKHLINCLCVSLNCESIYNDINKVDSSKIVIALLEELYPCITNDIVAVRIIEIILYNMCKDNVQRDLIRDVCLKYWSTENISEEIKLQSAVIICHTTEDIDEHCKIDEYVAYLCDVIHRMYTQRCQTYCGFSNEEIKAGISKIAVTVTGLKNKTMIDHLEMINNKIYKMINTIGIMIFRVDNFQANKTGKKIVYSPYFYSHKNGYKLRLNVYPAGDVYDTHLSVYFFLCKGEYDDTLSWPCTLSYRLSIINQKHGEERIVDTIKYDPGKDKDTNKPTSEDKAYGLQKFISHSELESIEGLMVNDCILIKCDTF